MKYFKMNNGMEIPVIGIGTNTFGKEGNAFDGTITNDTTELISAIDNGYRLIDTAIWYRNEAVIGKALKKSGIDRKEFFITSKIPALDEEPEMEDLVHKNVQFSLNELGVDYMDLYLIHQPLATNEGNLRVWRVLEEYVDSKQILSIGVSNFTNDQLAYLLEHARIKPVVNQIESHPDNWQDDIVEFCLANDVIPEAWGPLKRIGDESMAKLKEIASKHNKSWAQVILNYQISRGVLVIPKSHNAIRQQENLAIFDFELSEEDKETLALMK